MAVKVPLAKDNKFILGCNYWASHAGTAMWSDWKPSIVEKDLKKLADGGLKVLRVFPLWPDFQPIKALYGYQNVLEEFRYGEEPLPDDEAGQSGISLEAVSHFEEFCRIAKKYGLKIIVGLVTGWMSSRIFVPPALEGRNILTDPLSIMWQVRFVRYFVKHFVNCSEIIAWDLGNECNCIENVPDRESAWMWTGIIVNTIRSADNSRPVVSGMHSLTPEGKWTIQDQGEHTDILTTHPYAYFTPHCDQDPPNTIRTLLHATTESLLYEGIGGKPCLVEEIGTLGPMISNESIAADFARVNLFSSWAHGLQGLLWWCANDQVNLSHAPYDWIAYERELGLLRVDGSPKPVLKEFGKFGDFLEKLGIAQFYPRITDGVCILSREQDQWGVAYSSFVLSKQAGLDIEFQYSTQPIKDAPLYFLPSVSGDRGISKKRFSELLEKVADGAVLYISSDGGILNPFEGLTGLRVITRERRVKSTEVSFNEKLESITLSMNAEFKQNFEPINAEVIGVEADGNPAFTCAAYGKGKVYFLGFSLEMMLAKQPGAFHKKDAEPYWQIYRYISKELSEKRVVLKNDPMVGITEHPIDNYSRIIVMINYSPDAKQVPFFVAKGWKIEKVIYGTAPSTGLNCFNIMIRNCDAAIFIVVKE